MCYACTSSRAIEWPWIIFQESRLTNWYYLTNTVRLTSFTTGELRIKHLSDSCVCSRLALIAVTGSGGDVRQAVLVQGKIVVVVELLFAVHLFYNSLNFQWVFIQLSSSSSSESICWCVWCGFCEHKVTTFFILYLECEEERVCATRSNDAGTVCQKESSNVFSAADDDKESGTGLFLFSFCDSFSVFVVDAFAKILSELFLIHSWKGKKTSWF